MEFGMISRVELNLRRDLPSMPEQQSRAASSIFIGDARLETAEKVAKERACATAMANVTGLDAWADGTSTFKTLALKHKLAAKRGGFFDAYFAMDLLDEDALRRRGMANEPTPQW